MRLAVALAMGVIVCLPALGAAAPPAAPASPPAQTIELTDPQPGGGFPPLQSLEPDSPVTTVSRLQIPPRPLSQSPMAPLPPAIVAGPATIAIATWLAHRANRRGGKI